MNSSLEALSQPVSENMPSGENLEYDSQYHIMETLFWPRSEPVLGGGKSVTEEPNWSGVEKIAHELREKTRDLRIQVYASIASIHTQGLLGLRDNLNLLHVYLDRFWDSVHPQLDPQDDNDLTIRLSTLQNLDNHSLFTMALERVKLVELKGAGQFSVRDVDLALGRETRNEGEELPDVNVIRQAFVKSAPEHLNELSEAARESVDLLAKMEKVWKEKTANEDSLFENAEKTLNKISSVLDEFKPRPMGAETGKAELAVGASGSVSTVPGAINNRTDVVRVLGRVCEYYSVHEPSSPIPLLLRRAQRLVEKSFMEILEDMVPDGVKQARIVSGSIDNDT